MHLLSIHASYQQLLQYIKCNLFRFKTTMFNLCSFDLNWKTSEERKIDCDSC